MCGVCDNSVTSKQHPPNFMKDRRIKSQTTWWKAENGKDRECEILICRIIELFLRNIFWITSLLKKYHLIDIFAPIVLQGSGRNNY